MTTMFIRAYELVHGKVNSGILELPYKDNSQLPSWAKESVLKATSLKKINGFTDGTFGLLIQAKYSDGITVISGLWTLSK